jgi:hypothetical protein
LGAHDAIGKPYSLPAIVEKIRKLLSETSPRLTPKELGSEILPMIRTAMAMSDEEFLSIAKSVGHNLAGVAGLAMMPEVEQLGRELEGAAVHHKRGPCEVIMNRIRELLESAVR